MSDAHSAERIAGTLADALQAGDYEKVLKRMKGNDKTRGYRFDLVRDGVNVVVKVSGKRQTARRLVHVSKVKL